MAEYGNSALLNFYLWQYPSYIGHYALGATLANFYVRGKARAARRSTSSIPLLASILLVMATQYWVGRTYGASNASVAAPGIIFALEYVLLIYSAITSPVGSLIRGVFVNRAATSLGKVSYSLYTWHLPVEQVLFTLDLPLVAWGLLSVGAAIGIATASYLFVERPFLRLRSRFIASTVVPRGEPEPSSLLNPGSPVARSSAETTPPPRRESREDF